MLDLKNELKVAEEFWGFFGGKGTDNDLLECFKRVGIERSNEIDEYFRRFATRKALQKTGSAAT